MCFVTYHISIFRHISYSDGLFVFYHCFEIWLVLLHHCCKDTWEISERSDNYEYQSAGFVISRDLKIGRVAMYWNGLGAYIQYKDAILQYRKSHCGDKTVVTVLSPQWEFLYWWRDIFISNQPPGRIGRKYTNIPCYHILFSVFRAL